MIELSKSPQELAKTLLDTHTGNDEIDSLLLSAANAVEGMYTEWEEWERASLEDLEAGGAL